MLLASLYVVSAVAAAGVAVRLLVAHRRVPVAVGIAGALAGSAAWSAATLLGLLSPASQGVAFAAGVVPAVAVVVGSFRYAVLALVRSDGQPGRRAALLLVHPAAALVLGVTNPLHHLVVGPDPADPFGPGFWAHAVVGYGLLLATGVDAVRARRRLPLLRARRQLDLVLGLAALPTATTTLQLTVLPPTLPDLTPLVFVVVSVVDAYVILRGSALDVLPVARDLVLETLTEVVVVLDPSAVVVDANAAAGALLAGSGEVRDLLGRPATQALAPVERLDGWDGEQRPGWHGRCEVRRDGGRTVLDLRTHRLTGRRGRHLGTVLVGRDVTAEVRNEEELERAVAELRRHVATIERLRAEVAEQAVRDVTTGLHNRRYLETLLSQDAGAFAPGAPPVALALVDADRFKDVNDQHGHAAGDRVLEALGAALAGGARPQDAVVRYGGEEFVVVMPGLDVDDARRRVEDLRARCAAAVVPTRDGSISVTVSAGVAVSGDGRADAASLLAAADEALYEAKRSGRDRTCVAEAVRPVAVG